MFPDNICQNIDILVVINVQKNNFSFHSNQKTQGQKHQVNNLYFKHQVCQMILKHLNTFLQFRLLFHEPHCMHRVIFLTRQSRLPSNISFYPTGLISRLWETDGCLIIKMLVLILTPLMKNMQKIQKGGYDLRKKYIYNLGEI